MAPCGQLTLRYHYPAIFLHSVSIVPVQNPQQFRGHCEQLALAKSLLRLLSQFSKHGISRPAPEFNPALGERVEPLNLERLQRLEHLEPLETAPVSCRSIDRELSEIINTPQAA